MASQPLLTAYIFTKLPTDQERRWSRTLLMLERAGKRLQWNPCKEHPRISIDQFSDTSNRSTFEIPFYHPPSNRQNQKSRACKPTDSLLLIGLFQPAYRVGAPDRLEMPWDLWNGDLRSPCGFLGLCSNLWWHFLLLVNPELPCKMSRDSHISFLFSLMRNFRVGCRQGRLYFWLNLLRPQCCHISYPETQIYPTWQNNFHIGSILIHLYYNQPIHSNAS